MARGAPSMSDGDLSAIFEFPVVRALVEANPIPSLRGLLRVRFNERKVAMTREPIQESYQALGVSASELPRFPCHLPLPKVQSWSGTNNGINGLIFNFPFVELRRSFSSLASHVNPSQLACIQKIGQSDVVNEVFLKTIPHLMAMIVPFG